MRREGWRGGSFGGLAHKTRVSGVVRGARGEPVVDGLGEGQRVVRRGVTGGRGVVSAHDLRLNGRNQAHLQVQDRARVSC